MNDVNMDQKRREAAMRLKQHLRDGVAWPSVYPQAQGSSLVANILATDDVMILAEPYLPPPPRPADDAPCTIENARAAGMQIGLYEAGLTSPKASVCVWFETGIWFVADGRNQIGIPAPATIGDLRTLCRLLGDPLPDADAD